MAKLSLDMQVAKRLRQHKREVIMLWLIIAMGSILVPIGIGIYFCVSELFVVQWISMIPKTNSVISDMEMLFGFAKILGIIFSVIGAITIAFAWDRLSLAKCTYKMALFIKKQRNSSVVTKRQRSNMNFESLSEKEESIARKIVDATYAAHKK